MSDRFSRSSWFWRVILGSLLLVWAAGCRRSHDYNQYELRGRVVAKDAAAKEITLKHNDIPGFMPAMTMPYTVRDAKGLSQVEVGDVVSADLFVSNSTDDSWLQNLKILDSSLRGRISPPPVVRLLAPGDSIPDVPLVNEKNRTIRLSQFRGKALLVTFIYTRCPLPNFCPLITSHFAVIHAALEKQPRLYERTHLVSISFDPGHDTPSVLRRYALAYLDSPAGLDQWDFAVPSAADLPKLAHAFGLSYVREGNQISHSMVTVLIGPGGVVKQTWLDNQWQPADVLASLGSAAKEIVPDERLTSNAPR